MKGDLKPLYVKLTVNERARLDKVVALAGARVGRPLTVIDVIRAMIIEAEMRGIRIDQKEKI